MGTVRPKAEYLATLPTLDVMTPERGVSESFREHACAAGVDFRLELKLITQDAKYWLCTQGATKKMPGVLDSWIVGNVTRESLEPDADGYCPLTAYGPDETKDLQCRDYLHKLQEELHQLQADYERNPTRELEKEIMKVSQEIQTAGEMELKLRPKRRE